MIKSFKTKSGSTYEIDEENKLVRRLSGVGKPTERVGEGWKPYHSYLVSSILAICWRIKEDGVQEYTVTSELVS